MKPLTGAQAALLEALGRGATLRAERMTGRHKAQSRVVRADTGEDVTSVANALRERGYLRADYSRVKGL
jgi:hypothetical protein